MGRVLVLKEAAQRLIRRLTEGYPERRKAVVGTLQKLASDAELPGVQDIETRIPMSNARPHVRRVPGCNLWLVYEFDAAKLYVIAVVPSPPFPIDEEPGSDPDPGAS